MAPSNEERLRRINIPTPNPALTEWLMGPQCRALVDEVTSEIYIAYVNTLPVLTGNLRQGAYYKVARGGFGNDQDRWFGWVGTSARSYRPQKGYLYGRYIEYGKPSRGQPGQAQLRRAAHLIAGGLGTPGGINVPGLRRENKSRLRSTDTGRFVKNPLNQDK